MRYIWLAHYDADEKDRQGEAPNAGTRAAYERSVWAVGELLEAQGRFLVMTGADRRVFNAYNSCDETGD